MTLGTRFSSVSLLAAVSVATVASSCPDSPPTRDRSGASLLWRYPSQASCRLRPPAADSQRIFVPFSDGYVRALSRTTGALQWQARVGGSSYDDIRVVGGHLVVQVGGLGVVALDPGTGATLWTRSDSTDYPTGVISFDSINGVLVIGGAIRSLWGIRNVDGSAAWKLDVGEAGFSTAIAGRTVFLGTINFSVPAVDAFGHIFAVDLDSRSQRWEFLAPKLQSGSGFGAPLIVAGGLVVGDAMSGRVYAVDTASGQESWHYDGDATIAGSVSDGRLVFVPANSGFLNARNLTDGAAAWSAFMNPGSLYTEPALLGDSEVVVKDGSTLYALRRNDGKILWTYSIQFNNICSTPLVVGGDVVFDAEDGIYAVRPPL